MAAMCDVKMDVLSANLTVLQSRYPKIAEKVRFLPEKEDFCIFKAQDGGVAYGLRAKNGKIQPLTDAKTPTSRIQAQLNQSMTQLSNFTKPVLIVGLYPGNELLYAFDLCEQASGTHAEQPVYVCIDSLPCLYGFLQSWDAKRVLEAERVHFFLSDEIDEVISGFQTNPARPYAFTLISGAPPAQLNRLMPPFATLVMERDKELDRLLIENEQYYNRLDDEQLAQIISGTGKRKPRLLMPTCSWSTFVQHSTRDLCAAFEEMGWETRIINTDAMLTKYYLAHQINTFRPDVFLFIDHLRSEAEDVYPSNMMFVSWVQDEMDHFFHEKAGAFTQARAQLRKRDLVVGYVDRLLAPQYGYPHDRMIKMSIPADTGLFCPTVLSAEDQQQYGCELAFASNVSMATDQILEEQIMPEMIPMGFSRECLQLIHDHLWMQYRSGKTYSLPIKFERELRTFPAYREQREMLSEQERQRIHTLLYWRLNNTIYRHVVLEWADELGLDMHLYGQGWDQHPRFSKFARDAVPHGVELNKVYQAAKVNLHLNVAQGMHQRIWELIAAQVPILMRSREISPAKEPPLMTMQMLADTLCSDPFGPSFEVLLECNITEDRLVDWLFRQTLHLHFNDTESAAFITAGITSSQVLKHIKSIILARPDWVIPMREAFTFRSKAQFAVAIDQVGDYRRPSKRNFKPLGYDFTAADLTDHLLDLLNAEGLTDPALQQDDRRQTAYGGLLDATVHLAALFAHHTKTVREAPKDHTWINPLQEAFEAFPLKTYALRIRLADVLAHAHHLEAVHCCLPDDITVEPLSDDVRTRLAGVYISCGDAGQAAYHLARVHEEQRYDYWHKLQSILYMARGEYVMACGELQASPCECEPAKAGITHSLQMLSEMAVVTKRAIDNPISIIDGETAITWLLTQAEKIDTARIFRLPGCPSLQDLEGIYHLTLWAHQHKQAGALMTIREASAFGSAPESATALKRIGMIHIWLGQPDKTIQAFETILQQHAATEVTARLLLHNYIACWRFKEATELLTKIAPTYSDRSWWYYFSLVIRFISQQPIQESDFPTAAPAGSREAIILMTFGTLAVQCGYAETGRTLLKHGKDYELAQIYEAMACKQLDQTETAHERMAAFNPTYSSRSWLEEKDADRIADQVLLPISGLSPMDDFWKNLIVAGLMAPGTSPIETIKKHVNQDSSSWLLNKNALEYLHVKQGDTVAP